MLLYWVLCIYLFWVRLFQFFLLLHSLHKTYFSNIYTFDNCDIQAFTWQWQKEFMLKKKKTFYINFLASKFDTKQTKNISIYIFLLVTSGLIFYKQRKMMSFTTTTLDHYYNTQLCIRFFEESFETACALSY